jgi:hypothetical protein
VRETIKRKLRAEQVGNFNPLFCTYRGNKRVLVHSDDGDLSDPFRREQAYEKTLFIRVPATRTAPAPALAQTDMDDIAKLAAAVDSVRPANGGAQ